MRFYRVDTSRLTWGECWRLAPGLRFLLLGGMKLCRVALPMSMALAAPEELALVEPDSLPPPAREASDRLLAPLLEPRGPFRPVFCYRGQNLVRGEGFATVALSSDGRTVAQVLYSRIEPMEKAALGFASRLADGTVVLTVGMKREFDSPPRVRSRYLPGAEPEELWAAHARHVGSEAVPSDPAELILQNERRAAEWNEKRGVYRLMTEAEVQDLRRQLGPG